MFILKTFNQHMYAQTLSLSLCKTFLVSRKMKTTYEFGCIWKLIFINISVCAKLRHVENVFVAKYLWWNFICKQFYISNLRHNTRWFHQRFTQNKKNEEQTFNSKNLVDAYQFQFRWNRFCEEDQILNILVEGIKVFVSHLHMIRLSSACVVFGEHPQLTMISSPLQSRLAKPN